MKILALLSKNHIVRIDKKMLELKCTTLPQLFCLQALMAAKYTDVHEELCQIPVAEIRRGVFGVNGLKSHKNVAQDLQALNQHKQHTANMKN